MKFLLILLTLFSTLAYSKSPEGKGLICAYGKNKAVYEAYLFFNKKYISKFLYLENYIFSIKQNEKRNYSITNDFKSGVHFHATGTGKSWIAYALLLHFINKFPKSNVLWLCEQKTILNLEALVNFYCYFVLIYINYELLKVQ